MSLSWTVAKPSADGLIDICPFLFL